MLASSVLLFAFAAIGMAQAPVDYKAVYLTSKVDTKLTIVPKTAATGSNIRVFVPLPTIIEDAIPTLSKSSQTLANTAAQQWYLKDGNSSIRLPGSTLCMDGGAKSEDHSVFLQFYESSFSG
jgi:hypothetical protein